MMIRWLRRDVPQGLRTAPGKANRPRRLQIALAGGIGAAAATLLWSAGAVAAASPPVLGTVVNYAVIGGSTITNTGATVINGGLALSPGNSVTGAPVVTGSSDIDDPAAVTAQTDLSTAYTQAADTTPVTANLTGQNLGGLTLTPGIYSFSSSAELTGQLTLNGEGETDPTFIFQIGSTLTTASAARVVLEDGAGACSLFWQVGSSATLGTTTSFQGNLMTLDSITMNTGATLGVGGGANGGRALAQTGGAVTLDSNIITPPSGGCTFAPAPVATPKGPGTSTPTAIAVPTTGSFGLGPAGLPSAVIGAGALAGGALLLTIGMNVRRRRRAR